MLEQFFGRIRFGRARARFTAGAFLMQILSHKLNNFGWRFRGTIDRTRREPVEGTDFEFVFGEMASQKMQLKLVAVDEADEHRRTVNCQDKEHKQWQ